MKRLQLRIVNPDAAGVVAMFMRNHQGINIADVATVGGEPLFCHADRCPTLRNQDSFDCAEM